MYKKKKFFINLKQLNFDNLNLDYNYIYMIFELYGVSFLDFIYIKEFFKKKNLYFLFKKMFIWFFLKNHYFFNLDFFNLNFFNFFSKINFISNLNKKYFNLVLDFKENFRISLICFIYKIKYLISLSFFFFFLLL